MNPEPPEGIERQNEYIEELARKIVEHAPSGWERIEFTCQAVAGLSASSIVVSRTDGTSGEIDVPPEVDREAVQLRTDMHVEGAGTWFTAKYWISSNGDYETEFDYDSKPDSIPFLVPSNFAGEVVEFPRDAEHTPLWLREQLEKSAHASEG